MKKAITFLFVLTLAIFIIYRKDKVTLPKETIRFRIIADSNSSSDQILKMNIRTALLPLLNKISTNSTSIEDTRVNISNNLDNVSKIVGEYTPNFKVSFGHNYFPIKDYNNVSYPAGDYESLVITLGEGVGDNWWCILFPPLCLLEAEKSELDNVTYESYFKKIIKKYL